MVDEQEAMGGLMKMQLRPTSSFCRLMCEEAHKAHPVSTAEDPKALNSEQLVFCNLLSMESGH